MAADTNGATQWWSELFDDWFADQMFAGEERKANVNFLIERLRLTQGTRALDQCCGIGTMALALAERGVNVVGVDQSDAYITRARNAASARRLNAEFTTANALEFTPDKPVDGAYSWGMSWGYFDSDEANQQMLDAVFGALVPGGRFALETTPLPGVLRTFQHSHVLRRRTDRGEILLLRENRLDLVGGLLEQHWTYLLDGSVAAERVSRVRLYAPDVIVAMLRRAGFGEIEVFGSLHGTPLGLDSPHLIAVCRRPE